MDNKNHMSKERRSGIIWIILTIAIFLLGILLLVHIFGDLKRQGFFGPPSGQNFHRRKINVADIQGWMTFDFLNKSFHLSPDYLKKELGVTDKKYPNITINKLAKNTQQSSGVVLDKVKKLIQDFQNTNSSKPSSNI